MLARLLLLVAFGCAPVASTTYNAVVWCSYNTTFSSVCSNIEAHLNSIVGSYLEAAYDTYPITTPTSWSSYHVTEVELISTSTTTMTENNAVRRQLRSGGDEDQSRRRLPGPCPYSKCITIYSAQSCSYFCPGGRRRSTLLQVQDNENANRDLVMTSTVDYSSSLSQSLHEAAYNAFVYEAYNNPSVSTACRAVLLGAQCYTDVTTS